MVAPNADVIIIREKKPWQPVNGRWGNFDILAGSHAQ